MSTTPIKNATLPTTANTVASAPVSVDDATQLKQQLEQALAEINQAKQWDEYYQNDDRAEIAIEEAKITASLALINNFLKTGQWEVPAGNPGYQNGNPNDATVQMIKDLKPGWNGSTTVDTSAQRPDFLDSNISFAGNVYIQDNGDKIALQLDPTATELTAYNHGSDIVYVETLQDGTKKAWLGKDHVTNLGANIAIDAHNMNHGVKIDMSRVYRISDGSHGIAYGTTAGFSIIGSDYNDTLIGSEGADYILGLKGNDAISGMGGNDVIYGDDSPEWAKARGASNLADGNDVIDGGTGIDTIDGGGGINTGYKSDPTTGPDAEFKTNIQNNLSTNNEIPQTSDYFGSDTHGWAEPRQTGPGVVEIDETYDPGKDPLSNTLSLKMPDGYDMAFAEETKDGTQSLKITMVGKNADGSPKTFTILVKDALRTRNGSLNDPFLFKFSGNNQDNIIDFHSVDFKNNIAEISGAAGDDMILAPTNDLVNEGLSFDTLLDPTSRISSSELQNNVDGILPHHDSTDAKDYGFGIQADKAGISSTNNEIDISRTDSGDQKKYINIDPTADGFDKAYVTTDPNNSSDLLVVLVKQGVGGGTPETALIRIKNYQQFLAKNDRSKTNDFSFLVFGKQVTGTPPQADGTSGTAPEVTSPFTNVVPLIHADMGNGKQGSGTLLDGGDGNDFIFRASEDTAINQENEVIGQYTVPSSTPTMTNTPPVNSDGSSGSSSDSTDGSSGSTGGGNNTGTGSSSGS